jgi:hypothetical protein
MLSRFKFGLHPFALVAALLLAVGLTGLARTQEAKPLSTAELDQLVAPIALYPDDLLSQVLMASTYPLEVVEAARWSRDNSKVTGKALEDAMQGQKWDPSVKALTAVPETLQMMGDQLRWTQELGDAFLAQQNDVFDAVQRLRARADAAGNLQSNKQQKVTKVARPANVPASAGAPATAYTIVPTNPQEIYVPIYDPAVAYGAWPYPTYQPFFWYPPGYVAAGVVSFAAGAVVGSAIWGGVNWWNRSVNVNVNRYNSFNRTNISSNTWNHNTQHRGGVPYRDAKTAATFGDKSAAQRDQARDKARQQQKTAQGGKGDKGKGAGKGTQGQGGMAGKDAKGGMQGGGTKQAKTGGGMTGGGMTGGGGMAGGGGMTGGGMAATAKAGGGAAGAGMAGGGMAGGGMAGGMAGGGMAGGMAGGGMRR